MLLEGVNERALLNHGCRLPRRRARRLSRKAVPRTSTKAAQAQQPRQRLDCIQPHRLVPLHLPPALVHTGTDQPPLHTLLPPITSARRVTFRSLPCTTLPLRLAVKPAAMVATLPRRLPDQDTAAIVTLAVASRLGMPHPGIINPSRRRPQFGCPCPKEVARDQPLRLTWLRYHVAKRLGHLVADIILVDPPNMSWDLESERPEPSEKV
ncbi:hypothetical protein FB451DRAFT_1573683 [Mycena latifolia]|nr:hypothetical protein FB451DRAFT_1573683 [Mycena latifolia]